MKDIEENSNSSSNELSLEEIDRMVAEKQNMSISEINDEVRQLENDIKVKRIEIQGLPSDALNLTINKRRNSIVTELFKERPWLIANIEQVLDKSSENDEFEDPAESMMNSPSNDKLVVLKLSSRLNLLSSNTGLIDFHDLKPGDLVGIRRDNFAIIEKLPVGYDHRVKAMEVDERPSDSYSDIGGLDHQINEIQEAIILPITRKSQFEKLNILPSKGVLMHGPSGTSKTLIARAWAAETNATFLKLSASQLSQHFIGEGTKLVREEFALAKEKAPTIIFIDELDAIGMKKFDSDQSGDREVQRTMMELLNQLDSFSSLYGIKVIAATN